MDDSMKAWTLWSRSPESPEWTSALTGTAAEVRGYAELGNARARRHGTPVEFAALRTGQRPSSDPVQHAGVQHSGAN